MLVPAKLHDQAAEIAKKAAEAFKIGSPTDLTTTLGPMASEGHFHKVQGLIAIGIEEGARLVTGGIGRPQGFNRGYYVRPTVFANVEPGMTIAREEIFGPVLSIMSYRDEDEAVAIANGTPFGLAAFVQSKDLERARKIAERMRAGAVYVNYPGLDLAAPFGGYKKSGNGREYGEWGLDDFLEVKGIRATRQPPPDQGSPVWPRSGYAGGGASSRSRLQQAVDVEPLREHIERAVRLVRPFLDRAVPGELEAVFIGVAQIKRLVRTVVAGAVERNPRCDEAAKRVGKRGAGRIEDGGVVEAGRSGGRRRATFAFPGVDAEMVVVAAGREEGGLRAITGGQLEAEHAAIEGKRALDVGHLEVDMADAGIGIDRPSDQPRIRHPFSNNRIIGHVRLLRDRPLAGP